MKKNKIGGEKIMSVYWFAILFIVAAAIVYLVVSFYGKPYEIRNIEADLLIDKVSNCISYAGYLREDILNQDFKDNLLQKCGITFNVEDTFGWKEQGQYFIQIDFYDFSSYPNSVSLFTATAGNPNLEDYCSLQGKQLPFCLTRELYVSSKDGKQYVAKINSVIDKVEKNE